MTDTELQELIALDRKRVRDLEEQNRARFLIGLGLTGTQARVYCEAMETPDRATDYRA